MEITDVAALVSRWVHVFFATVAVGGTVMTRFALAPAASEVSGDEVSKYREAVRQRWMKWVMAAIAFLLISGVYNFVVIHNSFKTVEGGELPGWYHALFGTKIILAMIVFYIASVLVGKSESAKKARQNEIRWLNINFVLMVAIVCLAGILRLAHNEPSPTTPSDKVSYLLGGDFHG